MQLGVWVRAERKRRGWTIKTLAERMTATGLTTANEPYLTQLETGKINAERMGQDKLSALAGALGMTTDALQAAAGLGPVPGYLAALGAVGVDATILAELAAHAEYLTPDDWEGFIATARRRAVQYERQEGRGHGGTDEGRAIDPHDTAHGAALGAHRLAAE